MAGRPFGQGGQSGLLYGVVVFAIISAASIGVFIFQLTKNKAAESHPGSVMPKKRRALSSRPGVEGWICGVSRSA